MRVYHECALPYRNLPAGILQIKFYWKCPECHEKWHIIQYRASRQGTRQIPASWRHRRWARKQMKA